jgi:sugar lactone lactonase YvrE
MRKALLALMVLAFAAPVLFATPVITGYSVAPFAPIPQVRGITFDGAGNLYAIARNTGTIFKITPSAAVNIVTDLPDLPEGGYSSIIFEPVSGKLFVSRFAEYNGDQVLQIALDGTTNVYSGGVQAPAGLATDAAGNLYVSYFAYDGTVLKIPSPGTLDTFATGLYFPDGVIFGPDGYLYICNTRAGEIRRAPAGGGAATVFASGFTYPIFTTFDTDSNLLVADYLDGSLFSVHPTGAASLLGSGFAYPDGLAFDSFGNLFISDYGANLIYKATPSSPACAAARGDLSRDGIVSAPDVVLLLNCIFLGTGVCDLCFSDISCNGQLTSIDVVLLLNAAFLGAPIDCSP